MEIEVEFGKPWEVGRVGRFRRLSLDALSNRTRLLMTLRLKENEQKKIPPVFFLRCF